MATLMVTLLERSYKVLNGMLNCMQRIKFLQKWRLASDTYKIKIANRVIVGMACCLSGFFCGTLNTD